jgi:phospholipid/cholesterol/gamma-HCH transport system permease protein
MARGATKTDFFSYSGDFIIDWVDTAGSCTLLFLRTLGELRNLFTRFREIIRQIFICGVISLPVVTITAFFSGAVISAQVGTELGRKLGNTDLLGSIVGAAVCREMGPVFAAIVVAGLVGGSMSSVLGTMKVGEEIDALDVMGIDPVRFLVMPRLVAMAVAVPLLTVYADVIGIIGGAVVAKYQIGGSFNIFFYNAASVLTISDVGFGVFKGLVFGLIVTIVACDQGLNTSGGAEGVGRATMRTVVYSFLLVLIANYLLLSLIYVPFLL